MKECRRSGLFYERINPTMRSILINQLRKIMGCDVFVLSSLQVLAQFWDSGKEISAFDDNEQSKQELDNNSALTGRSALP